ncbi:toxin [Burkholderia cepacia]|uniref:Toxin n=2 Tax=Burkholderia cepacia complex TaxID=87882 RepID=A0A2S8IUV5_BURCE|nr:MULTISPECIES: toxin [Burkholderia cepacia complex]EKS9886124.1 toxin [Burkholderia pyrrocinia]EKS9895090.1 toxin [Burkholderia pyrrocinia]KFL51946.1 toxin [Burkholderia pyrrocinia]PQP18459.1 toxin [Burkholderia cepacia]HDR9507432.1 toxin [Burkholderia cepacia]
MRFVVVGTSGSGKSTFSSALAAAAGCPYIELDQLYWGPDWTAVPPEQFENAVLAATAGDRWVADGNYSAVRDVLWSRATHVVWLNFGRWTVFSRVLWRTLSRGLMRTELFHGNRESLRMAFCSKDSVLLWSYTTFARNRVKFAALRDDPKYAHLQWTEITGPSRTRAFIERHARAGS